MIFMQAKRFASPWDFPPAAATTPTRELWPATWANIFRAIRVSLSTTWKAPAALSRPTIPTIKPTATALSSGCGTARIVLYQALGDRAVRLDANKLNWIGAPIKGSPSCSIMGFTGLKTMDDVVKSGKALKMGSTRAGSTYNDLPMILNQTVGHEVQRDQRLQRHLADYGRHAIEGTRRRVLGLGVGAGDRTRHAGRQRRSKTHSDHRSQEVGRQRARQCSSHPRLHQSQSRQGRRSALQRLGQSI